jgi:hypothetical protein
MFIIYIDLLLSNIQKILDFVSSNHAGNGNGNAQSDEDYEKELFDIINGTIRINTYHLAAKNPILEKIMSACSMEDMYGLTVEQTDALEHFERQFNIKNRRIPRGEKGVKNEVKSAFEKVIRDAWRNYNLFDNISPRYNFESTRIGNLDRFTKTTIVLSEMIVSVLFRSKTKLHEVALPSSTSNFHHIQIYNFVLMLCS